jgi:hypothetical protein
MLIIELLDQYKSFCNAALSFAAGAKLNKSIKKNIIEILILFMVIPRRINFLQLERFGTRSEQCYRQTFERDVDWMEFNLWLSAYTFKEGSRRMGIAIDPSYISKAGKKTPHIGTFWSGCAGAAKHGLEILGIGVIDVDLHDCMMLRAVQTKLEKGKEKDDMTLYQWYAEVLKNYKLKLQRVSRYIVADAAFSKKTFVDMITPDGFHLVSRLRNDAVLNYIWTGHKTGKRGRPKTKGDKIDFGNIDKSKMQAISIDPKDGEAYALKAHCKSLGQTISLVIHLLPKGGHRLYFSTDENMSGKDVIEFYRTRFQIEFNYREAKQFTGLTHCQARDTRKLDFAYNASFAAVNLAKALRYEYYPDLSIGKLKALMVNAHYLNRIIGVFEKDSNMTLNTKLIKELFGVATDIAL